MRFALYSIVFIFSASVCLSQTKPVPHQIAAPEKPFFLVGQPNDLAINVIKEFSSEPKRHLNQIQRTKVILGFKTGTTVAQVNKLIRSINGTLVRTYQKSPILMKLKSYTFGLV